MSNRTYRNVSDQELIIVGVGVVEPGQTITTDVEITSGHFEEVASDVVNEPAPVAPIQVQVPDINEETA